MKIESGVHCTVIVTVDGEREALAFATRHAADGIEKLANFPGFVAGATHIRDDGGKLVQYLQWTSEAAHKACMDDKSWEADPSSQKFMRLVGSGALNIDVGVYTLSRVVDA